MKLLLASLFTLLTLFAFLFVVIAAAAYWYGIIDLTLFLALPPLIILLMWLIGPYIQDFILTRFRRTKWIAIEQLPKGVADFIRDTCMKSRIKLPKLGIIDDGTPTAFTYGSASFNARVVVSQGIFNVLEEEEVKSVYGHEIGHIVHRDFIIMTIATAILVALYQAYVILARSRRGRSASIGYAALAFYFIGRYFSLYLSRVREYYADSFAAERIGNPNLLSSALIKIAYGITSKGTNFGRELLAMQRGTAIMGLGVASSFGLMYSHNVLLRNYRPVEAAILWDKFSPWALLFELRSTHPLIGKRVHKLCKKAREMGLQPMFNFEVLSQRFEADRQILRERFAKDLMVLLLPFVLAVTLAVGFAIMFAYDPLSLYYALPTIGLFLTGIGIGRLLQVPYKYPRELPLKTSIADVHCILTASPMKGIPITVSGEIMGRGIPGAFWSEDMTMRDDTGFVYLNYESILPVVGNLLFGWRKVGRLIGSKAQATGWVVRHYTPRIDLKDLRSEGGELIKGRIRLAHIMSSSIILIVGLLLITVVTIFL